jgi:hypothetical protein
MRGVTVGRPKKHRPGASPKVKRIAVQASEPWVDWVERGAKFCRTDVSKLIDAALADYLAARGFPDKPPERMP